MRRHSLKVFMAMALGGLGLSLSATGGSALTVPSSTHVNMNVGHSAVVKIGNGKIFEVMSCTSPNANVVPCQLPTSVPHEVQSWCLAPTAVPIPLSVAFVPIGSSNPPLPFNLSVACKSGSIPNIRVLHFKEITPLQAVTQLALNSCSTNVLGATCTTQGNRLIEACSLAVTANALPVLVTANVIVDGAPAVNGKTMTLSFRCTS